MKIEDIVAKIQQTTTDRDAVPLLRALMDRLEGMLHNTDTARAVAEAAGMSKEQALRTSDQPFGNLVTWYVVQSSSACWATRSSLPWRRMKWIPDTSV